MADARWSELVLGSASPRRAALLEELGVPFVVRIVDLDESALVAGDDPSGHASAARIAQAKFAAFDADPLEPRRLLTADTLVACRGEVLGKPETDAQVGAMLLQMSGQTVTISTAVCFGLMGAEPRTELVSTEVRLRELAATEVGEYAAAGAGRDKAGGLALQSDANVFLAAVEGCWSNVLGLPLCAVAAALDLAPRGVPRLRRCSVELCGGPGGE